MIEIQYRVENKYIVSDIELKILEHRLKNLMSFDVHQDGECYIVKSLYFDDIFNSGVESNESGIDNRKKYRIRTYGTDLKVLNLEIKEKRSGFTKKSVCPLSVEEYYNILNGETVVCNDRTPLNEFFLQMRINKLMPKIIIEYERTAFVHKSGNVRITFDRNIKANNKIDMFLYNNSNEGLPVMPHGLHILEVKYDELIPDIIVEQLELKKLRQTSFSKFYYGRKVFN